MVLLDSYLPVFKLTLQIAGNPAEHASYDESRQICITTLEQAIADAGQCDASEEEKEAARFAVIAWLDETVLCSALPWRQQWLGELLQRKYLNTTVAGTHFFSQLAELDIKHQQARTVFLFCLQNDFHGQYGTADDRSDLLALIEALRKQCLPQSWHTWPNEAPVTSGTPHRTTPMPLRKSLLPGVLMGVLLLYGLLFLLLRYNVT